MIKYHYPLGATPLDLDETAALIPSHITTQSELNEWEQQNILDAELWAFSMRHEDLLSLSFLKKLHKRMFGKTWQWAGSFRKSNKNVGVHPELITTELKKLVDDVDYQIKHQAYESDEIAYRLHHRLVFIHPFVNGNGRHARTITDLLLQHLQQPRFSWGRLNHRNHKIIRQKYISALKKADKQDYVELAEFVRG